MSSKVNKKIRALSISYISYLIIGMVVFGMSIGFSIFLIIDSYKTDNTPTIHCNCPKIKECPEHSQEEAINNCIKVLNDAETIKSLVREE